MPGPGQYSHKSVEMDSKGRYYLSTLKNSGCRSFPHTERHGIMQALKEKSMVLILK